MKTPNKKPIVISNPCALACVLAVRNPLSKDHVPVRFLDSPSSRFPRNDNNVFRRFGFIELKFLAAILIEKIREAYLEITSMFLGYFSPIYRYVSLLTTTEGKPINPTG